MPIDLNRVHALCFDVDGTLADTDDYIVDRIAKFLDRLPFLGGKQAALLARRIVMDAETPTNAVYGMSDRLGLDDELAQVKSYLKRLTATRQKPAPGPHDAVAHELMDGVKPVLAKLAERFPMCTISTGGAERVGAFLEFHGILDYFRTSITAQTTERMKPFPDPILYAAEVMDVHPGSVVMIGDTTVDVLTGVNAGAQTIGVLCGFGTRDELVRDGADHIVDTTADVLQVLLPEREGRDGATGLNVN